MATYTSLPKRLLLLLAALALAAAACSSDGTDGDNSAGDPAGSDVDRIAAWLGMALPSSATEVQFEEITGGIDDAALLRFSLPASELDGVVADLGVGQLKDDRKGFFYSSGPDWFQTSDLETFAGAAETFDGRAIQITADLSGGTSAADNTTVYILAAEI